LARVAYLQNDEADPKVKEMFEKIEANGSQVVNLYRVLAHAPEICRSFIRFGNRVLYKGALSPTLREIAILLVSERTDADYERTKHRDIAQKAGVRGDQVAEVANWQSSSAFDERERALLQYTEEVNRDVRAREETFQALKQHFNTQAIVELTVTVGFYGMVSRILENLQVELEDDPTAV
jgi:uncharacterized peroxidase-related enzyme